eukprot:scaffold267355_cov32-Tisochrysis_lutea.AAC.2
MRSIHPRALAMRQVARQGTGPMGQSCDPWKALFTACFARAAIARSNAPLGAQDCPGTPITSARAAAGRRRVWRVRVHVRANLLMRPSRLVHPVARRRAHVTNLWMPRAKPGVSSCLYRCAKPSLARPSRNASVALVINAKTIRPINGLESAAHIAPRTLAEEQHLVKMVLEEGDGSRRGSRRRRGASTSRTWTRLRLQMRGTRGPSRQWWRPSRGVRTGRGGRRRAGPHRGMSTS